MVNGAKKSLYLFLTSLLGVMLFLIIHRIVFFIFIYMLSEGYITVSTDLLTLLAFGMAFGLAFTGMKKFMKKGAMAAWYTI